MKDTLKLKKVLVTPNGVDFNKFKPINKNIALKEVGWNVSKRHVLFAANPNRPEKNFTLAKNGFDLLQNSDIELHCLEDVPNEIMPFYLNAADVILLTSLWEGSPNVIKEAMACNTPIVSTDVGDVKETLNNTKGCYIVYSLPNDIASKIKKALKFNEKTTGREDIKQLNSSIVAEKLLNIYNSVLN